MDCSLGGTSGCRDSTCDCDAMWRGPNCSLVAFAPSRVTCGGAWRRVGSQSSWGGSVLEVDGTYHMYASDMSLHCGLDAWQRNSRVAHLTADAAQGPYVQRDVVLQRHDAPLLPSVPSRRPASVAWPSPSGLRFAAPTESRRSPPSSAKTDFYVWRAPDDGSFHVLYHSTRPRKLGTTAWSDDGLAWTPAFVADTNATGAGRVLRPRPRGPLRRRGHRRALAARAPPAPPRRATHAPLQRRPRESGRRRFYVHGRPAAPDSSGGVKCGVCARRRPSGPAVVAPPARTLRVGAHPLNK